MFDAVLAISENSMSTATISGTPYQAHSEAPASLADCIDQIIEKYPDAVFNEVTASGEIKTTSYRDIHHRNLAIQSALKALGATSESTILLLPAQADEFIASVWACIYGDYTWIPWSLEAGCEDEASVVESLYQLAERVEADLEDLHNIRTNGHRRTEDQHKFLCICEGQL